MRHFQENKMKNSFIDHIVSRTIGTKSETQEPAIIPDLAPDFGLYNTAKQLINYPEEHDEQHQEEYLEPAHVKPSPVSSQAKKVIQSKTSKVKRQAYSDTDTKSARNTKDAGDAVSKKETPSITKTKPEKEKLQEKITIERPTDPQPKSITKKSKPPTQTKSYKKETISREPVITNAKKQNKPQEDNANIISKSKKADTPSTNENMDVVNTIKKNSFVKNQKREITTNKNVTENTIEVDKHINNVKINTAKLSEKIVSSELKVEPKDETSNNMQEASPPIEIYDKIPSTIRNPNYHTMKPQKNNLSNVTINIDRIEIKANVPQNTKNNNSAPKTNRMSLSEYLRLRKEGAL